MFEKFTERARKVMNYSRQEAQRLNSEFIGTEHMLLGIIDEGGGVAAKVLKNLNIDLKRVRQEIEKLITPSTSPTVTLGQLPFSPRAKRVIELAGEAASMLGHDIIGTEHLLLGLLKENEGIAAQVLINLGLKLDEVRDMVLEVLGANVEPIIPEVPISAEPETGYMITLSPGLTKKQVDEVVSAIRMIKCVVKVEKARGLWIDHKTFETMIDLAAKSRQAAEEAKKEDPKESEPDKDVTSSGT